ncbi:hypothetical protein PanWU01x14_086980 [Parasponia andersonii]|uniref:Uncharacterized protein n=1 Tax=Parasponia andersonii TaxID=3476 RepID=A0A2P5D8H0_PARAD|nr:hypothetical protein PanWU01x14_086980 [Parasponia andersonii]
MSLVHNADSVQAAGSFVRSLQPGSMLADHLLLNLPYDMADVQAKSEGVFRVLESRQKAPKTSVAVADFYVSDHELSSFSWDYDKSEVVMMD